MHILVATAGALPPEPVADLAEHLVGSSGSVSVVSVIEVPRAFLEMLRAEEWRPLRDGEDGWPTDDQALAARYVEERGRRLVEPVVKALEARRIPCRTVFVESDDPASAIVETAEEMGADLIMMGATRDLFTESAWKSISDSVIRGSRCPVLVIPPPQRVTVPDAQVEAVRTPDERFADLPDFPYRARWFEWQELRLAYLDQGEGPPVVLFHGEPTWSFMYRGVIPPLVEAGYRVVAPDYPGFGRSDKPTDPAFYTYDRLTAAMTDLVEHLDVNAASAVVHDWGGPIGLRVAVEHPDRFSRLVVTNTALFTGAARPSEGFLRWRAFVERTEDLPIRFIMERSAETTWPEEVLAAYQAPFPDRASKTGAHRLPLIVPLDPGDPGAAEMERVDRELRSWEHPVLVCFSDQDPIFGPPVAERLAARIPGAGDPVVVEGAGHFLFEDRPDAMAAEIVSFLETSRP